MSTSGRIYRPTRSHLTFRITQNILDGNFDYIFMSNDDWSKLANDPSGEILDLYSVNTSKKVVLLVKK